MKKLSTLRVAAVAVMFAAGIVGACASRTKTEDMFEMPPADPSAPPPLILHPSETPAVYATDEALAIDMASDAGMPPPSPAGDGGLPNRNPKPANPNPIPNNPTPTPIRPAPSTPSHP